MFKDHLPVDRQVIVITGASSGIGLATARMAVEKGAAVVLAARNEVALARIVDEITVAGGSASFVVADVGVEADVERIAEIAIARFGRIDTWVNNAGLTIYGRLDEVSASDHERLFQTNFWGTVHGSLVAARHLAERGGALVNVGSIASDIAFPLQGMYCASKHAIRGFTDAFRMELEEVGAPISVTLIKPASIDTPLPQHARNYMDREPDLPPPVYRPSEVASAILHAATHPARDIYVGGGGRAFTLLGAASPRALDRLAPVISALQHRKDAPRDPDGSLHRPREDGEERGSHPGYVMRTSAYTRAVTHPAVAAAAVVGFGLAAARLTRSLMRR